MPTKKEHSTMILTNNLEKKINTELDKLGSLINEITDITYEKNMRLERQRFLKTQKISKFKNCLIKIFTFGCYDKNKNLRKKLNQNKTKIDILTNKENTMNMQYKQLKIATNKLISDFTKIKTNHPDKEFLVSNLLVDKINSQIEEFDRPKLCI